MIRRILNRLRRRPAAPAPSAPAAPPVRRPAFDRATFFDPAHDAVAFDAAMAALPAPDLRYIVHFTARSGSSWLTDIARQTGALGSPGEFFNPRFVPGIARSLGAPDMDRYVAALTRRRASGGPNADSVPGAGNGPGAHNGPGADCGPDGPGGPETGRVPGPGRVFGVEVTYHQIVATFGGAERFSRGSVPIPASG